MATAVAIHSVCRTNRSRTEHSPPTKGNAGGPEGPPASRISVVRLLADCAHHVGLAVRGLAAPHALEAFRTLRRVAGDGEGGVGARQGHVHVLGLHEAGEIAR